MEKHIAFIGLGKLGAPVALTMAKNGANVIGYDIDNKKIDNFHGYLESKFDYEENMPTLKEIDFSDGSFEPTSNIDYAIKDAELIFVAVPTPTTNEKLNGEHMLPLVDSIDNASDFEYKFLIQAVSEIALYKDESTPVVIISTVLPGTIRREILPLIGEPVIYNPFFIAMGTTVNDFLDPEFILIGIALFGDDHRVYDAYRKLIDFYYKINIKQVGGKAHAMSIESAELAKIAYNTFISQKISFANAVMEMAHKIPNADCDDVLDVLKSGIDRITSPKYLSAGMSDGGACHPRDNIALSWLAKKLELSTNPFAQSMIDRQNQTKWLVNLAMKEYIIMKKTFAATQRHHSSKLFILGTTYKKNSSLTFGSAAHLLADIAKSKMGLLPDSWAGVDMYDPHLHHFMRIPSDPSVCVVAMNHDCFKDFPFPDGSTIIDPWGFYSKDDYPKCKLVSVGRDN